MDELASERPNISGQNGPVSIPGRLRGALVVLVFQILANGFFGWVLIDSLAEDASHGDSGDDAGVGYFVGYLSLALAVVLLVCVVYTVRPKNWARPVVLAIESLAMVNGLVTLVNGSLSGLLGIVLAIAVTGVLMNDGVRDWYRHGRSR
jgi:hypothetical protein